MRRAERLLWCAFSALALLAPASVPAAAQSVLAAGGLGLPIEPVDGRGRALGSVGIGLLGTTVVPADPVGAVDLPIPTLALTLQSSWLDVQEGAQAASFSGNRFPALGVSYPVRDWGVLTLTYGAVLDQRWRHERRDTVDLEAGEAVPILDRFRSEGGVSAVRLGFAHRVAPSLAVGGAVGMYTGSSSRQFTRFFDTIAAAGDIRPFQSSGRWSYSGPTATIGAVVDIGTVVRGAAALTWSGTLEADPSDGTAGESRSYDLPLELRAALSGSLAPELSVLVSVRWADWSGTDDELEMPSVGGALMLGGGVEWGGASLFGRNLSVRLGWRRADLPFRLEAGTEGSESAASGGLGLLLLARSDGFPLALVDLAIERGTRSAGTVSEDFWRSTLSLRVAGF